MSATHRPTALRVIAPLLLAVAACDDASSPPDVEPRDGQTFSFKTTSTDQSFTWKGCEPPWGPDPYPHERWFEEVGVRVDRDLGAHALSSWRNTEASRECDEGCAAIELAWTGSASPTETQRGFGKVRVVGECNRDLVAVEVEVEVDTAFECACQ